MRDRLSHLGFDEAAKLLGPDGGRTLIRGGRLELAATTDLHIDDAQASVRWRDEDGAPVAKIAFDPASPGNLRLTCTACGAGCIHVGGLLSTILEQKSDLGLAVPPSDPSRPADEEALVAQALAERAKRAETERMKIESADGDKPWTDYTVRSAISGKTYRVALRGEARGISYCSCPDFKTSTLGTCKHVMKVLTHARKRFPKEALKKPYIRKRVTIHLRYGDEVALAVAMPAKPSPEVRALLEPLAAGPIHPLVLMQKLTELDRKGQAFFVTPDADELLERKLAAIRVDKLVTDIRSAPAEHPLRTTLLKEPLLPYQLDGIAFAVSAGRAILADEMGLGKTIQGVGVAELLARELGITKVLVVCPASLKSQWRSEIARFSGRSTELVAGTAEDRGHLYAGDAFFTICNYEQVLKDILFIEKARWDLVILDEGQRIKNWEAKTSRVIKGLVSRYALVLTGTPLENRIDDLHSVVSFVDPHQLGPAFRFLHRHQQRDERGALVGLHRLDELRERLKPVLLRRTRASVRLDLPARTVEIVRIAPTAEQKDLHDAHMRVVASIVRKKFFTEMDLLRLRMALLMARMAADSTFLVNKQAPGFSTKLERLDELFEAIASEPDRKVVLFSEWTTMLDLVEPLLRKRKVGFVRLDGSVPQKKRQLIVSEFQTSPKQRVFLTTNAGSTGLNLQAANTVINVDLPWNPAVLEQRIARAHRMGQKRPVHVYVLVTEATLEENLLGTLSSKRDLAMAALDPDTTIDAVEIRKQSDDLKEKLEILLGSKPEAPVVASAAPDAGAKLVEAALAYLGGLAAGDPRSIAAASLARGLVDLLRAAP